MAQDNNCTSEQYLAWTPEEGVPQRLKLDYIHDGANGLEIALGDNLGSANRILIRFKANDIIGYRFTNDSYTWRSDNGRTPKPTCSLNIVEGSEYIKWFKEETYNSINLDGATHYCILLAEECIDIASFDKPTIEFIASK